MLGVLLIATVIETSKYEIPLVHRWSFRYIDINLFNRPRIGENVNVTTVRNLSRLLALGRDFATNFNMGLSKVQGLRDRNVNLA